LIWSTTKEAIHANFHENFENVLKLLISEITLKKQFIHYQWHLQPTLIAKKTTKYAKIALTALVAHVEIKL
jgi:hypothetical protein